MPMNIKGPVFKKACLDAVNESRDVLEQHRGWKEFFAKFISAVTSILTLGLANLYTGKGIFGLFTAHTDAKKELDNFSIDLINNNYNSLRT
jgi:hypothetical protein